MNKIFNSYLDFINESKLELLLEANIKFLPRFTNLISKINSPITDALEEIVGKDIDVNTNFIDISTKEDSITFIPDDKIDKVNYVVNQEPFTTYYGLSQTARRNSSYSIGNISEPMIGTKGVIKHKLTLYELNDISPSSHWQDWKDDDRLVHFSWDNGKNNVLIKNKGLDLDVSDYKTTEYRVGKFINKILTKAGYNFTPVQIEDFVSKYKAQMKIQNSKLNRFDIVNGEDIRKYYLFENYYSQKGSLGTSCMKHKRCQPYFDIYVDNPEKVSMVILRLEEGYVEDYVDEDTGEITQLPVEDKIIGRAILWTDSKDRKVMDRIYVNDHSDVEFFKEFANKNNFLYKKEQDFNEDTPFMYKKAELSREDSIIKVELYKNVDYDSYPYMDTLKYYTISTGIITNEETRHSDYSLEDTEGNIGICSFCSGSGDVICPECSGNGTVTCIDCSGNGSQDCNFCNGYEHVTCPECDGDDPDCSFCNGDVLECPECNGSGKEDCEKCEGSGDIKCGFCNGDERVPCPDC